MTTTPSGQPSLWDTGDVAGGERDAVVDAFCRGEDASLDHVLLPFDVRGTAAHVRGLGRAGVLTAQEVQTLDAALDELLREWDAGRFTVGAEHEDGHTAIEDALTQRLGELGRKVHTARSRNDQVLTALRLFALEHLRQVDDAATELAEAFAAKAGEARAQGLTMPGYTHGQPAMPLEVAVWCESFRDALADDRRTLAAAIALTDQSPLGSASGFGAPIPLEREATARELGFARVQANPVYCQQSRLKLEAAALNACAQLAWTLGQFACDALLFTSPAYGFLSLPQAMTTGSSLMPNKRNPDVLELLRALHPSVEAAAAEVRMLGVRLGSGYHRDFQMSKRPFLYGLERTRTGVEVARRVVERLQFNPEAMQAALTPELYMTATAHELVIQQGIPFRDAYRQVKAQRHQRHEGDEAP